MSDIPINEVKITLNRDSVLVVATALTDTTWGAGYGDIARNIIPQLRQGDSMTLSSQTSAQIKELLESYLHGGLMRRFGFNDADRAAILAQFKV